MISRKIGIIGFVLALAASHAFAAGKPLKVFIMAGQSNMQGKARVRTIERLQLTQDSKQMYEDMMVKDGLPSAAKDVYGVYFGGDDISKGTPRPLSEEKGPLKPGWDGETTADTTFGPEYTFSIYMQKHLNEPILIIKTAWGGRDLLQQFRPPSAGPYEKDKDGHGNPIGHYYNVIIKRVGEVLADPGKYHPGYNKADGCEIAGFVWFQGFNDLIKGPEAYPEYSRLMACFIRDVRRDLKVPKMPFVIGVMGIGGPNENTKDNQYLFRKAQEAPALLPEFEGNVLAVRTEQCWDMELQRILAKVDEAAKRKLLAENPKLGGRSLQREVAKAAKSMAATVLTPEELKILQTGKSDEAYHYMGSAYTYGHIGKVLAEGMAKMVK
jgi:alpha-galactosidase